ncbi:MAG TPA: hypothetical protein ENK49_05805, partial [Gammaproteobacteria bacterium]|nr:hypothetical protein [Gammaproteobacteria bacterium]
MSIALFRPFQRPAERPVHQVPGIILAALLLGLVLQIGWHHSLPPAQASADELPDTPATQLLTIASLGDPVALSK